MTEHLKRPDVAREDTERLRDRLVAEPDRVREPVVDWPELYRRLWQVKLRYFHPDNR